MLVTHILAGPENKSKYTEKVNVYFLKNYIDWAKPCHALLLEYIIHANVDYFAGSSDSYQGRMIGNSHHTKRLVDVARRNCFRRE